MIAKIKIKQLFFGIYFAKKCLQSPFISVSIKHFCQNNERQKMKNLFYLFLDFDFKSIL